MKWGLPNSLQSLHATQFQRSPIKGRHIDRHLSLYLATSDAGFDASLDEQIGSDQAHTRINRARECAKYLPHVGGIYFNNKVRQVSKYYPFEPRSSRRRGNVPCAHDGRTDLAADQPAAVG